MHPLLLSFEVTVPRASAQGYAYSRYAPERHFTSLRHSGGEGLLAGAPAWPEHMKLSLCQGSSVYTAALHSRVLTSRDSQVTRG